MKKISFVIACYNEAKNIEPMYQRLTAVLALLPNYTYEIIFVDNASTDVSHDVFNHLVNESYGLGCSAPIRTRRN